LLILPVGIRHTDPKGGYFASPLGYSSLDGDSKTGAFLWLYWFGRSKSFSYDVGFPLLWSFRSPEANTTIVPPVFHVRRGGSSMGSAALLAWWGRDRDKGASWQLILPSSSAAVPTTTRRLCICHPWAAIAATTTRVRTG